MVLFLKKITEKNISLYYSKGCDFKRFLYKLMPDSAFQYFYISFFLGILVTYN